MRAIAIDDEKLALDVIVTLGEKNPKVEVERVFSKPEEAIQYLNKSRVDLVFLDINMPGVNGLELARRVPENIAIIFTTAYSDFAVESYELEALDYLLKPISQKRFDSAVEKAYRILGEKVSKITEEESCIVFRADHSLIKIQVTSIDLVEGLSDYIKVHVRGRKPLVVRMTMKEMTDRLPKEEFVRVNRSIIVPLRRIDAIKDQQVVLSDRKIKIGLTYRESVLLQFKSE